VKGEKLSKVFIYTDGSSLGNPGRAGIGVIIYDSDRALIKKISKFVGTATNNVAEYLALIYGLQEALALKAREVECFLDSELLVRQLKGIYKVRDSKLGLFYNQVGHLQSLFKRVDFHHIKREKNTQADQLARGVAKKG